MCADNHVWSAGDITHAVVKARTAAGFSTKIEVECRSVEEAFEAVRVTHSHLCTHTHQGAGACEELPWGHSVTLHDSTFVAERACLLA